MSTWGTGRPIAIVFQYAPLSGSGKNVGASPLRSKLGHQSWSVLCNGRVIQNEYFHTASRLPEQRRHRSCVDNRTCGKPILKFITSWGGKGKREATNGRKSGISSAMFQHSRHISSGKKLIIHKTKTDWIADEAEKGRRLLQGRTPE